MSERRLPPDGGDLSAWILEHPEVWGFAVQAPTTAVEDDAVRRITSGRHAAERANEFSRRRRRAIAGGALAVAVLAGGSVGVAALIRSGQPARPNEGIACRAAADVRADAIVIDIQADPVAECARLWSEGKFAAPGSELPAEDATVKWCSLCPAKMDGRRSRNAWTWRCTPCRVDLCTLCFEGGAQRPCAHEYAALPPGGPAGGMPRAPPPPGFPGSRP